MKHFALLHGLLLALASPLAAQGAQGAPAMAGADQGRRAWVVATHMPKGVPNPLPIHSDKAFHQVPMDMRMVSQSVPVDATGVVRVVKSELGKDGKVKHATLAVAQLEKGVREALIVLSPDSEKSGLSFRAKVIDLAEFKRGGCLFVNLVKTNIAVEIDDQRKGLRPGGIDFINALGEKKQKMVPISFFYEIPKKPKSEWKQMTSSSMALYQSRREICIFSYNEEIGNVDFRGIAFPAPMPKLAQRDR